MRIGSIAWLTFASLLLLQCSLFDSNVYQDIQIDSGGISLSGTLVLPEGKGPFPAVIFVHGSGPETRDNSMYSAKWFASIGYAALIYDKRGAGESEGDKREVSYFSFDTLANDVSAAVNALAQRQDIDAQRIGLHASSQGGWVVPLAASKTDLIRYMIIRSASVTTVQEDRVYERGERLKKEGFSTAEIFEAQEMQLLEGKQEGKPDDDFSALFAKNKARNWFPRVYGDTVDPAELDNYREWYSTIEDFDPIPYLQTLDLPVVWLFGDPKLDKSGPVAKSVANLEALKQSGKDYTILQYEGEGHNISESKYERAVFDWLRRVNIYDQYEFQRH